jgi:hypothetical protein
VNDDIDTLHRPLNRLAVAYVAAYFRYLALFRIIKGGQIQRHHALALCQQIARHIDAQKSCSAG